MEPDQGVWVEPDQGVRVEPVQGVRVEPVQGVSLTELAAAWWEPSLSVRGDGGVNLRAVIEATHLLHTEQSAPEANQAHQVRLLKPAIIQHALQTDKQMLGFD